MFKQLSLVLSVLVLFGCGDEEDLLRPPIEHGVIESPTFKPSDYFPMTIGSWWRYRNPDGSEWMREVSDTRRHEIHNYLQYVFIYSPSIRQNQPNFLKPSVYTENPPWLVFLANESGIVRTVSHEIEHGKGKFFDQDLDRVNEGGILEKLQIAGTNVSWHSDVKIVSLQPTPRATWEALEIRLAGGEQNQLETYKYRTEWLFTGRFSDYQAIETPMGVFENCLQIQYKAEQHDIEIKNYEHAHEWFGNEIFKDMLERTLHIEMSELYRRMTPYLQFPLLWLAPGVGPVKIETADGIAELIDYEIKPAR